MINLKSKNDTYNRLGTLPKPHLIGRTIRLAFGLAIFYFIYFLVLNGRIEILPQVPTDAGTYIGIVLGFMVFPEVVNIGWTLRRGSWPQLALILISIILAMLGFVIFNNWWFPLLGWFIYLWLLYTYIHLGISFIIASILATPGCEMRSIPHFWTKITGRETKEHFCPGMISGIDKWELSRK
jgi:hypothetical protein